MIGVGLRIEYVFVVDLVCYLENNETEEVTTYVFDRVFANTMDYSVFATSKKVFRLRHDA